MTLRGVHERFVWDQGGDIASVVTITRDRSLVDAGVDDVRDGGIQPENRMTTKSDENPEQAAIREALSWLGAVSIAAESGTILVSVNLRGDGQF